MEEVTPCVRLVVASDGLFNPVFRAELHERSELAIQLGRPGPAKAGDPYFSNIWGPQGYIMTYTQGFKSNPSSAVMRL